MLVLLLAACLAAGCSPATSPRGAAGPLTAEGRRRLDGCVGAIQGIREAVDAYRARTGRFPARLSEAFTGDSRIPTCPGAGADTYSAGYRLDEPAGSSKEASPGPSGEATRSSGRGTPAPSWSVHCTGSHHADAGVPPEYPRYDSATGLSVPVRIVRPSGTADSAAVMDPDLDLCVEHLKSLGTAVQLYSAENDGLLPARLPDLVPGVLKQLPTCPTTGRDTYASGYVFSQPMMAYTIVCTGSHASAGPSGSGYPRYTSSSGVRAR